MNISKNHDKTGFKMNLGLIQNWNFLVCPHSWNMEIWIKNLSNLNSSREFDKLFIKSCVIIMTHKLWLMYAMINNSVSQQCLMTSTYSINNYQIKSLILSRWCSKKNDWREFYMWHKKIISSWFKIHRK